MSGGVFICYRREESAFAARAIHDRVVQRLERENVFLDVDNIDLGVDWFNVLTDRVGACDALVAVMGRNWVSTTDEAGLRRIDDPDDFVRIEIEAALQRNVRVIPVLVDGAAMPKASELPESLKSLARRQGTEVSPARFDADVEKLTRALASILEQRRQRDAAEADEVRQSGDEHCAPEVAEAAHIAHEDRKRQEAAEAAGEAMTGGRLARAEALRMDEERRNEAAGTRRAARSLAELPRSDVSARADPRAIWSSGRWVWAVVGAVAFAGGLGFITLYVMNFGLGRVEKEQVVPILSAPPNETTWTLSDGKPAVVAEQAAAEKAAAEKAAAVKEAADRAAVVLASVDKAAADKVAAEKAAADKAAADKAAADKAAADKAAADRAAADRAAADKAAADKAAADKAAADKAASNDNPLASNCYRQSDDNRLDVLRGQGVYSRLPQQAISACREALASDPTNPRIQYELASTLALQGSFPEAIPLLRQAANAGFAKAQVKLGALYQGGMGIAQDDAQAMAWYSKAADQGDEDAKAALGRLHAK